MGCFNGSCYKEVGVNFVQLNSTFTIFAQNFLLEITSVLCILFLIKICAFQNQEVFFFIYNVQ